MGCGNFGGIGSNPRHRKQGDTPEHACLLLDQARSVGIKRFDTANSYGGGLSEEILGQWLKSQDRFFRQQAKVYTKVGNPFGSYADNAPLSRREIVRQLDRSLRRLSVDAIDIYFLHEPDATTSISETLEALEVGLRQGKIRSFGLSNVTVEDVTNVLEIAGPILSQSLVAVQNEFHCLHTVDSEKLIPFLAQTSICYMAYSPLAGGLLTGKYGDFASPAAGSRYAAMTDKYRDLRTPANLMRIKEMARQAHLSGVPMARYALELVMGTKGIESAVIAPRTKEHYESLGLKCT
jgi:aryl-alcohol dehydrogenase-like predicted oxidoreductase